MCRRWSWCAASLLAAWGAAGLPVGRAGAATIVERAVDVELRPDGAVREKHRLEVRLDSAADVKEWQVYPIALDLNRELRDLDAWAQEPGGKRTSVGRKGLDTHEVAGEGELHSSAKIRTVSFPSLPPGSLVHLEYEVEERPYFPADRIALGGSEATQHLRVSVHGGGGAFRFRLDGPATGYTVTPAAGGVMVEAAALPARKGLEYAAADAGQGPVLRYGWGEAADWPGVGRWWRGLLAGLPPVAEPVRQKARELVAGLEGKRARLSALLKFASREVRYVAVEVGVGGYRPAPAGDVLTRRWGDCKDKAVLLVELLREAGIEAYPALIHSGDGSRIDAAFASPHQFNHVIVAVRADGPGTEGLAAEGDPVSGGFLFVDPTPTEGTIYWLNPSVQDQDALVVTSEGGRLVHTPLRPELEERNLTVDLALSPEGKAHGHAHLAASGELGAAFAELIAATRPEEADRMARTVFSLLLPGAELAQVHWRALKGDVPHADLDAEVTLATFGTGAFILPQGNAAPPTSTLDDRTLPIVLTAQRYRVTWNLTLLPGACPPPLPPVALDNEAGSYRQTVTGKDNHLTVERAATIKKRWIEPAAFPALKELALAEGRTGKRRIRVECGG